MPEVIARSRLFVTLSWIALSVLVLTIDYLVGPVIQFQPLFIIPVGLAVWYSRRAYGIALAVALPLVRLYYVTLLDPPWSFEESMANAGIRMLVLVAFAILVARVRLSLALSREVEMLRGLLPICTFCKKIRDPQDRWEPLERYISARSAAEFSDSVCPACAREHYPETFDRR